MVRGQLSSVHRQLASASTRETGILIFSYGCRDWKAPRSSPGCRDRIHDDIYISIRQTDK